MAEWQKVELEVCQDTTLVFAHELLMLSNLKSFLFNAFLIKHE
jgi:hypothetical protein